MDNELLSIIQKSINDQPFKLQQIIIDSIYEKNRVAIVLLKRAVEESANYAEKSMSEAIVFTNGNKRQMWDCGISKLKIEGYIAEFGVFEGESVNYLANLIFPKIIFGFDSFLGLEEDFSIDYSKGGFNKNGKIPLVLNNVSLVKGSFSNTLPKWLDKNLGVFSFINIDCDTYESTSTVLNSIGPTRIVTGTYILFDEYFGFPGWKNHEFKAWQEYCNKNNVKYKYIALCGMQVLIEIL
jgi:hypothetical protein